MEKTNDGWGRKWQTLSIRILLRDQRMEIERRIANRQQTELGRDLQIRPLVPYPISLTNQNNPMARACVALAKRHHTPFGRSPAYRHNAILAILPVLEKNSTFSKKHYFCRVKRWWNEKLLHKKKRQTFWANQLEKSLPFVVAILTANHASTRGFCCFFVTWWLLRIPFQSKSFMPKRLLHPLHRERKHAFYVRPHLRRAYDGQWETVFKIKHLHHPNLSRFYLVRSRHN